MSAVLGSLGSCAEIRRPVRVGLARRPYFAPREKCQDRHNCSVNPLKTSLWVFEDISRESRLLLVSREHLYPRWCPHHPTDESDDFCGSWFMSGRESWVVSRSSFEERKLLVHFKVYRWCWRHSWNNASLSTNIGYSYIASLSSRCRAFLSFIPQTLPHISIQKTVLRICGYYPAPPQVHSNACQTADLS